MSVHQPLAAVLPIPEPLQEIDDRSRVRHADVDHSLIRTRPIEPRRRQAENPDGLVESAIVKLQSTWDKDDRKVEISRPRFTRDPREDAVRDLPSLGNVARFLSLEQAQGRDDLLPKLLGVVELGQPQSLQHESDSVQPSGLSQMK